MPEATSVFHRLLLLRSPRHPEVRVQLSALSESVAELTRRTEPDFLRLASDLKGLYTCADGLGKTIGQHAGQLRDALRQDRLSGSDGLAARSIAGLAQGLEEAGDNLDSLEGMRDTLRRLQMQGRQMERIARVLQTAGSGFAVESARKDTSREAFAAFVAELRTLAAQIGQLGEAIADQAEGAGSEVARLTPVIATGLKELRQLTKRSEAAVRESSEEMQQLLDSSSAALAQAETRASHIGRHASDAVYHLQFGDIVRQKLEHVASGLAEASRQKDSGAAHLLAIQGSQLESVLAEIKSTQQELGAAFSGLGSETENVVGDLGALLLGGRTEETTFSKKNTFENLNTSLLRLEDLTRKGGELSGSGRAASERAAIMTAGLSRHLDQVETINRQMRMQALNSLIKTEHLGDDGKTLGVLSMYVHNIFLESNELVSETVEILKNVTATKTAEIASREDVWQGGELQAGVAHLTGLQQALQGAASEAEKLVLEQRERLSHAQTRLEFLSELESRIREFIGKIDQLKALLGPAETPVSEAEIGGRYTMESERAVHRRLAGVLPSPVALAEQSEDNVELF